MADIVEKLKIYAGKLNERIYLSFNPKGLDKMEMKRILCVIWQLWEKCISDKGVGVTRLYWHALNETHFPPKFKKLSLLNKLSLLTG